MTSAQKRLVDLIRSEGGADDGPNGGAEYWPVMNDWVKDAGPVKALALRNINRTVEALIRDGIITLDEDGLFHLTEAGLR